MSVNEQAAAAIISQLALAGDGAVLGLALAYVAAKTLFRLTATSSSLRKIRSAPSVRVSDLRSVLSDSSSGDEEGTVLIVRGAVEARSTVEGGGGWKGATRVLVSEESGERGVVLQRTHTCIYNEWRGFFGWTSDLRTLFARSWRQKESSSLRTVPFVLVEGGWRPQSEYMIVNLEGSKHPLPLVTVYHQLQPIDASPYTFLQALFGHEYPVGLLDEEKLLPLGKDITAIGRCTLKNGIAEIRSCKDLPYFLSDLTKDDMLVDLAFKTKVLLWSAIVAGAFSVGIISYAAVRNWNKWKAWRQRRQAQRRDITFDSEADDAQITAEDDEREVADGELCVICLTRRRRSAFIPCGHLLCCQRCALSVERVLAPKCPVCRQTIYNSVRIYDS